MLTFKRKPWTLTLLVSLILAISFASVVEAGEFERRDHDVFRRMVKKRSPQGLSALGLGGANDTPVGAAQDPAEQLSAEPSASPPVLSVPPLPSVEPSLIPSISVCTRVLSFPARSLMFLLVGPFFRKQCPSF
jgi:hypothetical protein